MSFGKLVSIQTVYIKKNEWSQIYVKGDNKLRSELTLLINDRFYSIHGNACSISFKINTLKKEDTKNKNDPFVFCAAVCTNKNCPRTFRIYIQHKPFNELDIPVKILSFGNASHSEMDFDADKTLLRAKKFILSKDNGKDVLKYGIEAHGLVWASYPSFESIFESFTNTEELIYIK